ncbi:hypothetical protein phiTE_050 [Pectobacterium phage phiTE]|uniref:Uncharacterized protein n=1 Tax=Pectobacterium phage phiTE TaxID=1116482 RepID=K9L4V2_9CAUD|nr:hypothetical protein phiTE_050 [Pectobacterium phage phiTE]AEZ66216.1 hypothetical protein phiTE_050 [Pectobacterium phage phiTE]
MGEIVETGPDLLEKFFGRELYGHDRQSISLYGMPKYCCGTPCGLMGVQVPGTPGISS